VRRLGSPWLLTATVQTGCVHSLASTMPCIYSVVRLQCLPRVQTTCIYLQCQEPYHAQNGREEVQRKRTHELERTQEVKHFRFLLQQ
jgi:hypothetical protein